MDTQWGFDPVWSGVRVYVRLCTTQCVCVRVCVSVYGCVWVLVCPCFYVDLRIFLYVLVPVCVFICEWVLYVCACP